MELPDSIDEESGSAYELPSDIDQASSNDGRQRSVSRSNSKPNRGRSASTNTHQARSERNRSVSRASSLDAQSIHEDASKWASIFKGPQSPGDITSPTRGRRAQHRKRKAMPANEVRAKRMKGFYSNEYRGLLNLEIRDAVARTVEEDQVFLDGSQIGSSLWTPKEKHDFFCAVSRVGSDNLPEIALFIKTKSELQVREYIYVLQHAMQDRYSAEGKKQQSIAITDHPAALEISNECCSALERAADALEMRQEIYEQQREEAKWGDTWLLDTSICKWIENQRRTKNGEQEIHDSLPAANFFNLSNWLVLSHRVFMNAGGSREADNWEVLAEADETPAIRATAFEDFHSLAVSITKRLVSTTHFCTESRLRATKAKKVKHAEISKDDVEAAVKILGLALNSDDFWREGPRRCHLDIVDDENYSSSSENVEIMPYDEVEVALGGKQRSRVRSRTRSVAGSDSSESDNAGAADRIDFEDLTDLPSSPAESDDNLSYAASMHSEAVVSEASDHESHNQTASRIRRTQSRKTRIEDEIAAKRAQEEYTKAFDQAASLHEEQRLWTLLHQTPPCDSKPEPVDLADRPRAVREESGVIGWRYYLEYWSPWETLSTPVPSENFIRRRRGKDQQEENREVDGDSEESEEEVSSDEEEEEYNESEDAEEHHTERINSNEVVEHVEVDTTMIEITDETSDIVFDHHPRSVDMQGSDGETDIKSEPEE